jgi:molybdate transport system substrate-binding protein
MSCQVVHGQEVLVAAAADLAPLQKPLAEAFIKESGIRIRFSLGSSGMMARQVANGAPFDVYLAANEEFVTGLAASGHLDQSTVTNYATGRIGLWSLSGKVKTMNDLYNTGTIAIPNPRHAPYGVAAEAWLKSAGAFRRLQPKLIVAENVRQAFEFARTGNTDAVLTAWTLLIDAGGVLVPESGHPPIRQFGGIMKGARNLDSARRFMAFLTGPKGQAILQAGGLFPPK